MSDMLKWFENPYADDCDLLNDWVEQIIKRVSWELFEHQHDVVYMANETDSGIPKLKEDAIDVMRQTINSELSWLRGYIISRILVAYAKDNIDLGDEGRWYIDDQFNPEDAANFWKEIDKYIWHDYVQFLGEERTAELWEQWGKAPLEE